MAMSNCPNGHMSAKGGCDATQRDGVAMRRDDDDDNNNDNIDEDRIVLTSPWNHRPQA